MKKCLTSLAIREMKIKELRVHLTPVRITDIKTQQISATLQRCGGKALLTPHWQECKLVQPL